MVDATRIPDDDTPVWLRATPMGRDLEGCHLQFFHRAIDELLAETVPESYWRKVIESRRARRLPFDPRYPR